MSQKGFSPLFVILGFLVILGLVVGAYHIKKQKGDLDTSLQQSQSILTPSTQQSYSENNEATSWETYNNSTVGFQIKYPSRYGKAAVPSSEGAIPADGTEDNISIQFFSSPTDYVYLSVIPFDGNLEELKKYGGDVDAETIFLKNGPKIDDSESRWYVIKGKDGYKRYKVDFTGKGHGFTLEYEDNHPEKEIEEILSTFHFTK